MRVLVSVILLLVFPGYSSLAQQSSEKYENLNLICIADKSTGFIFDEGLRDWKYARFNVSDSKYVFSKADSKYKSIGKYKFTKVGQTQALSICYRINDLGFGLCKDLLAIELSINVESLRYQLIYSVGFVAAPSAIDQPGNSPSIEIGRCSHF